jgi:hypothetical protein
MTKHKKEKIQKPYEGIRADRKPLLDDILSKYLTEKQIDDLAKLPCVETKKLLDKTLSGKFKFSYTEFQDGSFRLKISASKKSRLIRNDSVCTESFIDKQTLVFDTYSVDSPLNFNNAVAKHLKKDIKAFFKTFKQSYTPCCEED